MAITFRSGARLLIDQVGQTLKRPSRLLRLLDPEKCAQSWRYYRMKLKAGDQWDSGPGERLSGRRLDSYDDYLELQKSKLAFLDLRDHEQRFREALGQRLADLPCIARGKTALCLGARLGGEVAAFIDQGCFSVGLDLNPGAQNPYVVTGDFHRMQFADGSVDIVYSNSIDHAFDLGRLMAEVRRILKADGHLIFEPDPGRAEGERTASDLWQTLSWETTDVFVEAVVATGFELISRRGFAYPRGGTQLLFQVRRGSV